jgi:hypothetical protein
MARITIIGDESMRSPQANTPEDAAREYFTNRVFMGNHAPRPAISRWRPDQKARFEAELAKLEKENRWASEAAARQAGERPIEPGVVQT